MDGIQENLCVPPLLNDLFFGIIDRENGVFHTISNILCLSNFSFLAFSLPKSYGFIAMATDTEVEKLAGKRFTYKMLVYTVFEYEYTCHNKQHYCFLFCNIIKGKDGSDIYL